MAPYAVNFAMEMERFGAYSNQLITNVMVSWITYHETSMLANILSTFRGERVPALLMLQSPWYRLILHDKYTPVGYSEWYQSLVEILEVTELFWSLRVPNVSKR